MSWLRKTWHDPVGSKVIAWAITAVLGLTVLAVWARVPSVRAWVLERLDGISRLQVIGWFALGVAVGGALGALIYRRAVRDRLKGIKTSEVFNGSITREPERELNKHELRALKLLAENDGDPVDEDDFPDALKLNKLRTDQVLDGLARRKLIIRRSAYPYQCFLTDGGRDLVIELGLG